jgi:hypothetical protein
MPVPPPMKSISRSIKGATGCCSTLPSLPLLPCCWLVLPQAEPNPVRNPGLLLPKGFPAAEDSLLDASTPQQALSTPPASVIPPQAHSVMDYAKGAGAIPTRPSDGCC